MEGGVRGEKGKAGGEGGGKERREDEERKKRREGYCTSVVPHLLQR